MHTHTLTINGQAIAYRESSGTGPAALLVHGNSSASSAFLPQLESPLGERYRLVAIDLPGHGQSDPAADPAATYTLPGYAAVLRQAAEQLRLTDAVLVGWSLGGHIALEASPDFPDAAGLCIFGTPPLAMPPAMEAAFLPHPAMGASFAADLTEADALAYATAFFRPGAADVPAAVVETIRGTDGRARATLGASIATLTAKDEVALVAALKVPLAVIHGEEEQLINGAYFATLPMPTLWRGAVQQIAGAGHAPHWEQPEEFNRLLAAFIDDCNAARLK
ncbi:MAG TPA: alpha/beta hydrolase [Herpetosiphonaceae bacterium]|nr:alpha/beta hydrolase [Herpetosiphonaceae bacterium]